MIWRSLLTTARRSDSSEKLPLLHGVVPEAHHPAPRLHCALRASPPHRGTGKDGEEVGRVRGVMQDKDRCHPSPRPHMTWTQTDGCSRVPRRHPKGGVLRRTDYRPNMGVTSSMLLGLEYAAGLREGSGRSELVP
jgi:hypothetical protein